MRAARGPVCSASYLAAANAHLRLGAYAAARVSALVGLRCCDERGGRGREEAGALKAVLAEAPAVAAAAAADEPPPILKM